MSAQTSNNPVKRRHEAYVLKFMKYEKPLLAFEHFQTEKTAFQQKLILHFDLFLNQENTEIKD